MGLKTLSNVVNQNLTTFTKRPIIYADSTWAGSGAYGAALITNVYRSWENLRNSIAMAIGLSMYGFSNTVTDVCGTIGPLD
jgi:alpha-glucosidase (family GH31 glycosyl hydrolase)